MNMRCYHFNNFYMNGIHAGIQSAHVQHELAMRYLVDRPGEELSTSGQKQKAGYIDWALNHKTMIVLNGGMQSDLADLVEFLALAEHPYAWAHFHEEEAALNGALTNVGLVLPENIYGYASAVTRGVGGRDMFPTVNRIEDGVECQLHQVGGGVELHAPDGDRMMYTKFDVELMARLSRCRLM